MPEPPLLCADVLILEGTARESQRPAPNFAERLAAAYSAKYVTLNYSPAATTWDNGGLFEIVPHTVIAWTSFTDDPTKFILTP